MTDLYCRLRNECEALEELAGELDANPGDLTTKDLKRLDKAITVLKVGFKLIKAVMRAHDRMAVRNKKRAA